LSNLSLRQLVKRYGAVSVVKNVSLEIAEGEFVSLLGPSGCGKTTILRMVAGLVEPSDGAITIGGRDITRLPPNKRNVGLVFQSYALFPHMTVFENVAFGLRRKGESGDALAARVNEALSMVRLDGYGERYPRQLAGSSSASPWRAPSRRGRACCFSTSRSPISTPSCATRCRSS
jgi:ABC-type Fe3+/spermidine/putrescine transport system ATPase subunit